jgi:hypothetical protein
MFKRYEDMPNHWLLAVPVSRKRWIQLWDPVNDVQLPPSQHRMHLCIAVAAFRIPEMRFREYRLRIAMQYL